MLKWNEEKYCRLYILYIVLLIPYEIYEFVSIWHYYDLHLCCPIVIKKKRKKRFLKKVSHHPDLQHVNQCGRIHGIGIHSYKGVCSVMPQSHCAESTPEWGRIDNSSLFEWSFLVILGHSSNNNDNDNQFEQCSSRPCSFSRSVRKFWTCSKSLCTQQCPAWKLFIRGYTHSKRVVIFFVAQLTCCILVIFTVFVFVLTVYYVIHTDSETGADQKTVRTKTNGAAK